MFIRDKEPQKNEDMEDKTAESAALNWKFI